MEIRSFLEILSKRPSMASSSMLSLSLISAKDTLLLKVYPKLNMTEYTLVYFDEGDDGMDVGIDMPLATIIEPELFREGFDRRVCCRGIKLGGRSYFPLNNRLVLEGFLELLLLPL